MKLAGMVFIVVSAGSVGFRIAISLKKRCGLFRQFLAALQILHNEIAFCGTPLPQAFALAAISAEGTVERLFSSLAKEMDRRRWMTPQAAMQQAWATEPELQQEEELHQIMLGLAAGLGKYDRESQLQTLAMTRERLENLLQAAEQERSVRSKTYETLGICAGLAMTILLV